MTYLTQTILDAIRSVGHHIGRTQVVTADGHLRHHASARDRKTNEMWTVTAPTEYDAAYELALADGFDLEDW